MTAEAEGHHIKHCQCTKKHVNTPHTQTQTHTHTHANRCIKGFYNVLDQVHEVRCDCVTGNANDAKVSDASCTQSMPGPPNLVGHSYTALFTHVKGTDKPTVTIVEGTRFVMTMTPQDQTTQSQSPQSDAQPTKTSTRPPAARNCVLSAASLMELNKAKSLAFQLTKLAELVGNKDSGCPETMYALGEHPNSAP